MDGVLAGALVADGVAEDESSSTTLINRNCRSDKTIMQIVSDGVRVLDIVE